MKTLTTLRIYFEYGQKMKNSSFWKRHFGADFSEELMKRAKNFRLQQVLHLNVNKGYLNDQSVHWGKHEIKHYKHPHLIEIVDSEEKINQFLDEEQAFLQAAKIVLVKNTVLLK